MKSPTPCTSDRHAPHINHYDCMANKHRGTVMVSCWRVVRVAHPRQQPNNAHTLRKVNHAQLRMALRVATSSCSLTTDWARCLCVGLYAYTFGDGSANVGWLIRPADYLLVDHYCFLFEQFDRLIIY